MKISFTIPFYSTPEFLDAAVRSVIAQSETDWELIVVDDRSPHRSIPDQIKSYGDSRIKYSLNEENLGQSGNWNRCLELANSDLVTILHADDELMPNYSSIMLEAAERHPSAWGFFCQSQIIDGAGKQIFSFADYYKRFLVPSTGSEFVLNGEGALIKLLHGNFIMCPTLCYRRSKLGPLRFSPDWKCAPDLDFTSRMLMADGTLVGLPMKAFRYRRHEDSGTAVFRKSMKQFEEEIALYNSISERALSRGWNAAAKTSRKKQIVKLRLGYFGLKDLLKLRLSASFAKFRLFARLILKTG